MFSVTNTGTNFLPLWTAKVSETMSGRIVERRDQVLITRLFGLVSLAAAAIFLMRYGSTKGPFLTLRGITSSVGRCTGRCACCGASCSPCWERPRGYTGAGHRRTDL